MIDLLQLAHEPRKKWVDMSLFWIGQLLMLLLAYHLLARQGYGFKSFPITITAGDAVQFFIEGKALLLLLYYLFIFLLLQLLHIGVKRFGEHLANRADNDVVFRQWVSAEYLVHDKTTGEYSRGTKYDEFAKRYLKRSAKAVRKDTVDTTEALCGVVILITCSVWQYPINGFGVPQLLSIPFSIAAISMLVISNVDFSKLKTHHAFLSSLADYQPARLKGG